MLFSRGGDDGYAGSSVSVPELPKATKRLREGPSRSFTPRRRERTTEAAEKVVGRSMERRMARRVERKVRKVAARTKVRLGPKARTGKEMERKAKVMFQKKAKARRVSMLKEKSPEKASLPRAKMKERKGAKVRAKASTVMMRMAKVMAEKPKEKEKEAR